MLGLRSWKSRVALGAAVAIAGSALGLYLVFRPHSEPLAHGHPTPTPQLATPPPPVVVGTTTETTAGAAEYLSVVSTSPASQAVSAKANAPITLSFNLPVDPVGVQNSFSVLPPMGGGFKQGATPQDVVFTPDGAFPTGGSVNVVIRKGLTSVDGFVLQDDFSFTFATQVASNDVAFQSDNQFGSLFTSQSGATMAFSVQTGEDVPDDVTLQTYRAAAADLVKAFVYRADGQYTSSLIDTSAMKLVDTKTAISQDVPINVAQPDGIYLLLVSDANGQYGSAWVDFSKYGVLLRQDDQKIVVAGQDLTTGDTNLKFDIAFYRLLNKVQKVISGSFTGTAEFPAAYPARLDLGVATGGGEEVIVPMEAPGANADIKIMGSLSRQFDIYLTTDRAAYHKGDAVKFAGVVRLDNDQAYTIPAPTKVVVWLMNADGILVLTKPVNISTNGTFAGGFVIPTGAFNKDGTDAQVVLNADVALPSPMGGYSQAGTGLVALGTHSPTARLTVTFDKTSYVARDTIVASITGTDNLGKPLAGKVLKLNLYSNQNSAAPSEVPNFPGPLSWGFAVRNNVALPLDSTGRATYSFPANAAKKGADQQVTLFVRDGSTATTAAIAARSTIVYQAAAEVFLLPSRTFYRTGDVVKAPFVVETVTGDRVPNAEVSYELDNTIYSASKEATKVAASGTLTTDANGVGVISVKAPVPADNTTLKIQGRDVAGNVFQAIKTLNVYDLATPFFGYDGADQLVQLSVATDKIAYKVGESAHLVVTSPASLSVLMSVERGRIHQYKWLTLAKGDNQVTLGVTPDMVPGFTLVFAYFHGGSYLTEALPIVVNDPTRILTMTATPDQATYTAGQTAHLDISIKDSAGNPVAATVVVDGYDASMSAYKLFDQAPIAGRYLEPVKRSTNASSSLAGIGGYGGRCGGGPGPIDQAAKTNPGKLVVWLPALAIDATGHATIDVPISTKTVRLVLIASTPTTAVGQVELDLPVQ